MESTAQSGSVQRQESIWCAIIVEYHQNWLCPAQNNTTRNLLPQKKW